MYLTTNDGSRTVASKLYVGEDGRGETYHSLRGARGEAKHVFVETGFGAVGEAGVVGAVCGEGTIRVLEMGFGTGLNAWLTLEEAEALGRSVEYVAVEKHPVALEVVAGLGYTDDPRFERMHAAPWGEWMEVEGAEKAGVGQGFRLLKLAGDVAQVVLGADGTGGTGGEGKGFDVVYWDAFAPDTQPELWTEEIFRRVAEAMTEGGVLVTYSAKGSVRRALAAAGFRVERLPGALGKRHMTKATKI